MSEQVVARSNRGFNGNTFDDPRNHEVKREVEDEWEVVDEEGVEK